MAGRSTGLRWERISDAVGDFVRRHGTTAPRRAVLCTYDFDPERFQAVLFPLLTRRGRQFRTLVLADAGALQQKLRGRFRHAFGRYELAPVRCLPQGVFHPKVILLRAGDNYLVGIGSSNLTAGGFGGNLEFMLFVDQTHPHGTELLQGVASFLQRLVACQNILMPTTASRFIQLALSGVLPRPNVLLDTLELPLLPQMVNTHRRACGPLADALTVISPWHSSERTPDGTDPQVVKALRQKFGISGHIRVCTQGQNGAGPDLGQKVQVMVTRESTATSDSLSDDPVEDTHNHRPTELHAKAYLVRGARASTFFFGSANCTQPALLRSVGRRGNVEVLVASKIMAASASAIEKDLQQLFTVASKQYDAKVPQAPSRPKGLILAGHIKANAQRVILQLEAPGVKNRPITIAVVPRTPVRVLVKNGIGPVDTEKDLNRLFPDGLPSRQMEAWSTVLWEKSGSDWIPFPVTIPLADPTSGQPVDALNEILEEECGGWPPSIKAETAEDADEHDGDESSIDDEDITGIERTLTEAHRQGELDRIAVAAALLCRRIIHRFESQGDRRTYFKQLQERLDGIDLAPHLASIFRKFLQSRLFPGENR